eukprot:gnl/TRDRNA2_/TRDRNA2_84007_c0_seq1.p1 gnl/TRDRNA2_/TRDRNA2_84007_c0~~gnl/TRDRNA2_/TRDRNA2_84007_c0_seq1.p1  ORF type:complete len:215 (+),score=54.08 gnl/TRDRNA2_/TRDRNA2_84007_c0_seq1:145-789(+)
MSPFILLLALAFSSVEARLAGSGTIVTVATDHNDAAVDGDDDVPLLPSGVVMQAFAQPQFPAIDMISGKSSVAAPDEEKKSEKKGSVMDEINNMGRDLCKDRPDHPDCQQFKKEKNAAPAAAEPAAVPAPAASAPAPKETQMVSPAPAPPSPPAESPAPPAESPSSAPAPSAEPKELDHFGDSGGKAERSWGPASPRPWTAWGIGYANQGFRPD